MAKLGVTISDHIWIEKAELAPALLKRLEAELSHENPAYISAQKFGRTTRKIPRVLKTFVKKGSKIGLPRGYMGRFLELAFQSGFELEISDQTTCKKAPACRQVNLRDYQEELLSKLLEHDSGFIVAPPGAGKTILGISIYQRLGLTCLWLTHTRRLAKQTAKKAEEFLGIEVGMYGGGVKDIKPFTVGITDTLINRDLSELRDEFSIVIIDEAHHLPASTFTEVVTQLKPKYIYGLTATPYRGDELEPLMFQLSGPIRASVTRRELRDMGYLIAPTVVVRKTGFTFPYISGSRKYGFHSLEKALKTDEIRNSLIATDVTIEATHGDNTCIVLVKHIPHGQELYDRIEYALGDDVAFVHSKLKPKEVDAILDSFEEGEFRVLIATYKMLAEGFDYKPSNRLFLTAPYKSRVLIEQGCGRIERVHPDKTDAFVFDYVDSFVEVLERQATERMIIYRENEMPLIT